VPAGLYFRNFDPSSPAEQYKMLKAFDIVVSNHMFNASNTAFLVRASCLPFECDIECDLNMFGDLPTSAVCVGLPPTYLRCSYAGWHPALPIDATAQFGSGLHS
jgi:hypothetical protein